MEDHEWESTDKTRYILDLKELRNHIYFHKKSGHLERWMVFLARNKILNVT